MRSLIAAMLACLLLRGVCAQQSVDPQHRQRVDERRRHVQVIVHRGASSFARENSLAAYRIAIELGADGNEIDIRATRDQVLVCFHDDMLDQQLVAFGDVADYTWAELQQFEFRLPGRVQGEQRIATLEEVFQLHQRYGALMHLDVKRPDLEQPIIDLLDRLDLWDHVVAVNLDTAAKITQHPKYRGGIYKGSLYADRAEWDPPAIERVMEAPGDMVIVDDPRGVLIELGRQIGMPQIQNISQLNRSNSAVASQHSAAELLQLLNESNVQQMASSDAERKAAAAAILRCAHAAEEIRRRRLHSEDLLAALENRAQRRSVHPEWMYHGLDGASALRALAELDPERFVRVAAICLRRIDSGLKPFQNPLWNNPVSWMDFRTKVIVFPLIEQHHLPGAKLCREYLQMSDEEAEQIGPLQFEAAAKALLTLEANEQTAVELLQHRRGDVRGAAMLMSLASHDDTYKKWGRAALEKAAPHALQYALPQ